MTKPKISIEISAGVSGTDKRNEREVIYVELLLDGDMTWNAMGPNIEYALLDLVESLAVIMVEQDELANEANRLIKLSIDAFEKNHAIDWGEFEKFLEEHDPSYKKSKKSEEDE